MIYHDSTNISTSPFIELNFLLNWIVFKIFELNNFLNWISLIFLNWIIFWIEFLWNDIELNIELNHFLAKFKYWIESIWVSFTPRWVGLWGEFGAGQWPEGAVTRVQPHTLHLNSMWAAHLHKAGMHLHSIHNTQCTLHWYVCISTSHDAMHLYSKTLLHIAEQFPLCRTLQNSAVWTAIQLRGRAVAQFWRDNQCKTQTEWHTYIATTT